MQTKEEYWWVHFVAEDGEISPDWIIGRYNGGDEYPTWEVIGNDEWYTESEIKRIKRIPLPKGYKLRSFDER